MDETLAMLALSGGGSPAGLGYAFVFRPGGVADKNVFTTWPTLYAAVNAVQGPRLVEIDVSIAPAVVPTAGMPVPGWNLDDWTLTGVPNTLATGQPLLTFADGAVIDPATRTLTITQSLGVQSAAPGATIWTPAAGSPASVPTLYLTNNSFILPNAAAPIIHVTAGVIFNLLAEDGSIGDTVNPVVQVDAAGTLNFNASSFGGLTAHAVSGAGAFNLSLCAGGFFEQPQGLEPVITYIDPPHNIGEDNPALIGPAAPVVFTSVGTITRSTSGLVQGSACATVTGAGAGAPVLFEVLRNPGAVLVATQTVDGGATNTHCTLPVFDTLPDQVAHTYAIRITQAASPLTIPAFQARIAISELN